MQETTDPARELVELCRSLTRGKTDTTGDEYLARAFGVAPWSVEFFQIVFAILDRIQTLREIVAQSDISEHLQKKMSSHLDAVSGAFGRSSLLNLWHSAVQGSLSEVILGPLEMLSAVISKTHPVPNLTAEEILELSNTVEELLSWLGDHQLKDQDFIRQALIDGLVQFQFRLTKLKFVGLGYTLESLRDVIGAYMALERGSPDLNAAPDAGAVLSKVRAAVSKIYDKIKQFKEAKETADFVLEIYGAAALLVTVQHQAAGLLK